MSIDNINSLIERLRKDIHGEGKLEGQNIFIVIAQSGRAMYTVVEGSGSHVIGMLEVIKNNLVAQLNEKLKVK